GQSVWVGIRVWLRIPFPHVDREGERVLAHRKRSEVAAQVVNGRLLLGHRYASGGLSGGPARAVEVRVGAAEPRSHDEGTTGGLRHRVVGRAGHRNGYSGRAYGHARRGAGDGVSPDG